MRNIRLVTLVASAAIACMSFDALACTRFIYETGTNSYIVGRSMDWAVDPATDLWSFPKGLKRDGGAGPGSIEWTSKHGSVISSFYNIAAVDGMNDARLVANALYLVESDYGDAKASGKPLISVGAWTQYALDKYSTVTKRSMRSARTHSPSSRRICPAEKRPAATLRLLTLRATARSSNISAASSSSITTANIR